MTTWPKAGDLALFTDLYELSMLQSYHAEEMTAPAVFSLFVRRLPRKRNYLLACGLEPILEYLENLRFTPESIAYLESLPQFSRAFLDWLANFRFEGEVHAMPEGTVVFENEPLIEIVASLPQAQLVETFVMNQAHLSTVLASKATRVVQAAEGRTVVDFGSRRMHGVDAALKAARAFTIAGLAATSNVLAGRLYRVPVAGTMAHSYVQAHENEADAFKAFARAFPGTILLVDTYDTLEGVKRVIALSKSEAAEGFQVRAVRLDSGDLESLSKGARALLDEAGLNDVEIFASGGLDEGVIAELLAAGAPIDGFGVGTALGVSADAPGLDIAYKLCEYAGQGRLKLSAGKPILPGRKQVFRQTIGGIAEKDVVGRAEENLPGRPLLQCVMRGGRRLQPAEPIGSLRERAASELAALPPRLRRLDPARPPYPVEISPTLARHQEEVRRRVMAAG